LWKPARNNHVKMVHYEYCTMCMLTKISAYNEEHHQEKVVVDRIRCSSLGMEYMNAGMMFRVRIVQYPDQEN